MEFLYDGTQLRFKLDAALLVFVLLLALAFAFRRTLAGPLRRLTKISAVGIAIELGQAAESLRSAIELAQKGKQWPVNVPEAARRRVVERAGEHFERLCGRQLLWIDDHPEHNLNERRMFRQIGIDIDAVTSTDDAVCRITAAGGGYDAVISDISRGDDASAGLAMLTRFAEHGILLPVIFYVGTPAPGKGTPAGAFGLAQRPDELLHLVIDVMERCLERAGAG